MSYTEVRIEKNNIKNPHQRDDAVELVWLQIVRNGFESSLTFFMHHLLRHAVPRNIDYRLKEAKDFREAEENLRNAVREYDLTLKALKERMKPGSTI